MISVGENRLQFELDRVIVSVELVLFQGIYEGSIDVQATLWSDVNYVIMNLLADVEFSEHVTIA